MIVKLIVNIKLDKRYNIGEEIEVNESTGNEIIKRKLGILVKVLETPKAPEDEGVDYAEMKYNDLRALAKEKGIELGQNPPKEEIIEALEKSDKE